MVNNYDNFFLLIKLVSLNLISRYFQLQPGVTYNTMTKVRQLNVYVSIHHSTLINRKLETMFVFFFFFFSFLNKYLCGFDMFLFFLWQFIGITEENLDKLLSHALIPTEKKAIITNMQHLNLQIIQDQSRVCKQSRMYAYVSLCVCVCVCEKKEHSI